MDGGSEAELRAGGEDGGAKERTDGRRPTISAIATVCYKWKLSAPVRSYRTSRRPATSSAGTLYRVRLDMHCFTVLPSRPPSRTAQTHSECAQD